MATSTAVSTLVLALEARNNSAGAFAELRGQLREQVEAAQSAARQTEEAARQGQARQLLALRQQTAQELLELRQKTEYEAQQIRQGAAGTNAAARQAAEQRIQMLRQDTAQEALVMRQAQEQQALAIRETTATQLRASREQLEAVERGARTEAEAMRSSQASAASSAREAARVVVGRPSGGETAREGGLLGSMAEFGKQMVLWQVGYAAVNRVTEAVGGFAGGLVTANSRMEQFHQTFQAIYGSGAAADQATAYLTQFALAAPDTRENVMQAGETISSLGLNIQQVMTPLGNVAAVMGKDMPTAAQAFADAYEGRFQMMQMSLHITKGQLIEFGMQVDHNGHVLNNSFVPAFERLAQAKFGPGMSLQMQTAAGVFSNVQDALENLQRVMGKPMFALIKKDLGDFMALLSSPKAIGFAQSVGTVLGNAFHAVSAAVRAAAPIVMGAINLITGAWAAASPLIQTAINAIKGTMATMGTFLRQNVLPAVEQALGQIIIWWNQNRQQIGQVLGAILGVVQAFVGTLQQNLATGLNIVHGIWEIGWGVISGSFSLILDLLTGNWRKFANDLTNIMKAVDIGELEIFKGLVDKVIQMVARLAGPINQIEHMLYGLTKPFADEMYALYTVTDIGFTRLLNRVIAFLNDFAYKIKHAPGMEHMLKFAGINIKGPQMKPLALPSAKDVAAGQAGWEKALTLGFRPGVDLHWGASAQKAQATFDKMVQGWEDTIARGKNLFTGDPSTYGTKQSQTKAGKDFLDQLNDWLKAHRIKLPGMPAAGGPGGTGTDLLASDTQPFDARSVSSAQQAAIAAAETRFQLDLARGTITQAQGRRDIAAIVAAQRSGGASHDQLLLTSLQDTRTLDAQLLEQARKHFDFDAGVAHPSRQKLHQDELAMLGIMAQTPGMTPIDLAAARQDLDKRIDQIMGGHHAAAKAVAAYKQSGFDLAAGASYGSTTVTMGPQRDQLVAAMQRTIAQQDRQLAKQDALIKAQGEQLAVLHKIEGNTAGTHQAAEKTAQHVTKPQPRGGQHSFSQRTGTPFPL